MGFCTAGFAGCLGRVPLSPAKQCKKHRIYARVKAKIEASNGEGEENAFIKAVTAEKMNSNEDFSLKVKKQKCRKDCCDTKVTMKEANIPGMEGLKQYFQSPQPLSRPGKWNAAVEASCRRDCCVSTAPVTKLHEQVSSSD